MCAVAHMVQNGSVASSGWRGEGNRLPCCDPVVWCSGRRHFAATFERGSRQLCPAAPEDHTRAACSGQADRDFVSRLLLSAEIHWFAEVVWLASHRHSGCVSLSLVAAEPSTSTRGTDALARPRWFRPFIASVDGSNTSAPGQIFSLIKTAGTSSACTRLANF